MTTRDRLLERARDGQRESKNLEFKSSFNRHSREEWCELLKDLVAMANSGGGVVVFGVDDDGSSLQFDHQTILDIDAADIANKFVSYTGFNFSDFETVEVDRQSTSHAAWLVFEAEVPLVFVQHGAHVPMGGERRPAFAKGSVYFRHGAKSEPCTRDDLISWHQRELAKVRSEWLGGIRQVVEAPIDHVVQVVPRGLVEGQVLNARIAVDDSNAVPVRPQNAEEIWPHRESDVVRSVRQALPQVAFNGHDIRSLKLLRNVNSRTRQDLVFKPHKIASPQYSDGFVQWVIDAYNANNNVFQEAREHFRAVNYPGNNAETG